jgi:diketogulonate reductase-like aldo/keto reductase
MIRINRRQFGIAGAALALATDPAEAQPAHPIVQLPQSGTAPALGQGTWHLAQGRRSEAEEEQALQTGLSLGMTLIDTAELYGSGRAERMVGRLLAGKRDQAFIVSKVLPNHATRSGIRDACAASLARLGTDHLDLYLLHWRGDVADLHPVVETFEALRQEGRIRRWGVSNFSVPDLEELMRVPHGENCATNQVRYGLDRRGAERELVPWCSRHGMPIMAYSPLGSGGGMLRNAGLGRVAARLRVNPAAVAIAWTLRNGRTISIPESGSSEHVRENATAATVRLSPQDLVELDQAFPA